MANDGLNEAQRAAVDHDHGPLLVLAGAGTGKTRVITQRIGALLQRGIRPEAILAVSFTNKAAEEMQARLEKRLDRAVVKRLWLSTFHRFGLKLLQEDLATRWGPGDFVIFDQGDALGVVRELYRKRGRQDRQLDVGALQARISLWKNQLRGPDQIDPGDFEYDAIAHELYPQYQESLRSMRAVDFDDLVLLPVQLLQEREDLRDKWRQRFRHLLVDEFQDTNHAQLTLVRLLANEMRNVCVVGDDDQAIYAFRGAEVSNILDFESHFPGAKVVKLEENYRSRAPILAVANAVVAQAVKRHRKQLRTARGGGAPVQRWVVGDADREAAAVAAEIRVLRQEGTAYGDMAVLYRSNLQARPLEEELRVAGIPYRVLGGTQYFDRKEVKDALAYLRAVVHPRDELSLRRAMHVPPRGIGPSTVERLARYALAKGVTFYEALSHVEVMDGIPLPSRQAVREFQSTLRRAAERFRQGGRLVEVAKELFSEVGLQQHLMDSGNSKVAGRRQGNIDFLLRSIERYEDQHPKAAGNSAASIGNFLSRLALQPTQEESEESSRGVLLSTLHGVKGLEFSAVFLLGCVEGQMPHGRSVDPKLSDATPTAIDEERRLFYVGVTRARDRLYLMVPERRTLRGQTTSLVPSRFLDGLPPECIEERQSVVEQPAGFDEVAAATERLLAQLQALTP